MPPIEILASSIFAQSFIVFFVAGLMWTMYIRVNDAYLKAWAISWLSYSLYLAIGGFGFLAMVGEWRIMSVVPIISVSSLFFGYLTLYFLYLGLRIITNNQRIRKRDTFLVALLILAFTVVIGLMIPWVSTQMFYFLTFSLRSMVAGVVCALVAWQLLKLKDRYGIKVIAYCLLIYAAFIQVYFIQGVMAFWGLSVPPPLLGSMGIIDFILQVIIGFSIVSWVLSKEHSAVLKTQKRLQELAWEDSLTGLPNRLWLDEQSTELLKRLSEHNTNAALVFIDLDGFKTVNDTWGHAVGDHLLMHVATLLRKAMQGDDMVCRMGGDEFIWFIVGHDSRQQVIQRAIAFRERLEAIGSIDGHDIHISCSQGVAWFPENGIDLETLIQLSDQAMYEAKRQGKAQLVEVRSR